MVFCLTSNIQARGMWEVGVFSLQVSKFMDKFNAAAAGRFGSGWAWLVVTPEGLQVTSTPNQVGCQARDLRWTGCGKITADDCKPRSPPAGQPLDDWAGGGSRLTRAGS
jgi:hypothetical protein